MIELTVLAITLPYSIPLIAKEIIKWHGAKFDAITLAKIAHQTTVLAPADEVE